MWLSEMLRTITCDALVPLLRAVLLRSRGLQSWIMRGSEDEECYGL